MWKHRSLTNRHQFARVDFIFIEMDFLPNDMKINFNTVFFLCRFYSSISVPEGVFVATTSSIMSFGDQFNNFF